MPVSIVLMMVAWANQLPQAGSAPPAPVVPPFFDFWKFSSNQPKQESLLTTPAEAKPFAWMDAPPLFDHANKLTPPPNTGGFAQLLDGNMATARTALNEMWIPRGLHRDPDRWRYRLENRESMYKLTTKIEVPNPDGVGTRFTGRDWYAEEKLHVPVPLTLPVADQVFMFGQFYGSGDSFNNQQTSINGKTGVGLRWSLVGTDLQLRYATMFAYADMYRPTRFSERTLPALEVLANRPFLGPLQIEYWGAAIPALTPADRDQLRQELRFALPLNGDNELEFGARYRWEYGPGAAPWVDRAQLFFGIKLRH